MRISINEPTCPKCGGRLVYDAHSGVWICRECETEWADLPQPEDFGLDIFAEFDACSH